MWNGTFEFETSLVVLCEGLADKAFLRAITRADELPNCDIPWPVLANDDYSAFPEAEKLYGIDSLGPMLGLLDKFLILRPELRDQLKGVLIVVDARDEPETTFEYVCQQVTAVGRFGVPTEPLEVAQSTDGRPALAVMLIPNNGIGALETVCIEELSARIPEVYNAMKIYLSTEPIETCKWKSEKRDKAKLHCMIVATNERNPTMTLQWAFSQDNPIIDVTAACFDELRQNLRSFCEAVGAI